MSYLETKPLLRNIKSIFFSSFFIILKLYFVDCKFMRSKSDAIRDFAKRICNTDFQFKRCTQILIGI